jgi:hypothetical protein
MLLLVAALLIASSAFAQPNGAVECVVWSFDDDTGEWVQNDPDNPENNDGRLFRSGEAWEGNCNRQLWDQEFTIHASVAHWIDFRVDWTRWDWFIRKPGTYAGDGIEAWIKSNGDVTIDFDGFADLEPEEEGANPLEVHYSYTVGDGALNPANVPAWYEPEDMNESSVLLDDIENDFALHYGLTWYLWSKITVIDCNSSCEYWNYPTITLTLSQQKDWINFETGEWALGGGGTN